MTGTDVQVEEDVHAVFELVVTEEIEGHERLDVLDSVALIRHRIVTFVRCNRVINYFPTIG